MLNQCLVRFGLVTLIATAVFNTLAHGLDVTALRFHEAADANGGNVRPYASEWWRNP